MNAPRLHQRQREAEVETRGDEWFLEHYGQTEAGMMALSRVGIDLKSGIKPTRWHGDLLAAALPFVPRQMIDAELSRIHGLPVGDRLHAYAEAIASSSEVGGPHAAALISGVETAQYVDALDRRGDAAAETAARHRAQGVPVQAQKVGHKPANDGSLRATLSAQLVPHDMPRDIDELRARAADDLESSANRLRAQEHGRADSSLRDSLSDAFTLERTVDLAGEFGYTSDGDSAHATLTGTPT